MADPDYSLQATFEQRKIDNVFGSGEPDCIEYVGQEPPRDIIPEEPSCEIVQILSNDEPLNFVFRPFDP